ncbi:MULTISPECIES: nucleotidyltransferase family protein [unclassified Synechococcus]|uniref:nucleotidyltransferase family protein n=2 Tax=unclassified Synechococcus TaxID=2626047 RepID=UPI002102B7E2|nr:MULTISPECIES: nucleotidyltransferase domain-containing protein [unclassified Synechococcus]
MADLIHQAIPGSEVRLFGSRARGQAGPDSDIDLLITAGRVPFRGVNPEARLP